MGLIDGFAQFSKFQKFMFIFFILIGASGFVVTVMDGILLSIEERSIMPFFNIMSTNLLSADLFIDDAVDRLQDENIDQYYASYLRASILRSIGVIIAMGYLVYLISIFIGRSLLGKGKDEVPPGMVAVCIIITIVYLGVIEILVKVFVLGNKEFSLPFTGIWNLISNYHVLGNIGSIGTNPVPQLAENVATNITNNITL